MLARGKQGVPHWAPRLSSASHESNRLSIPGWRLFHSPHKTPSSAAVAWDAPPWTGSPRLSPDRPLICARKPVTKNKPCLRHRCIAPTSRFSTGTGAADHTRDCGRCDPGLVNQSSESAYSVPRQHQLVFLASSACPSDSTPASCSPTRHPAFACGHPSLVCSVLWFLSSRASLVFSSDSCGSPLLWHKCRSSRPNRPHWLSSEH